MTSDRFPATRRDQSARDSGTPHGAARGMSPEPGPADAFDAAVDAGWAATVDCRPEDLYIPATRVRPREAYAGMNAAFFWFLRRLTVIDIDPALEDDVRRVVEAAGPGALTTEPFRTAWAHRNPRYERGLVFLLRPGTVLPDARTTLERAGAGVRACSVDDHPLAVELAAACPESDNEEAFVSVKDDLAAGAFVDGKLVSLGSAYARNGCMDLGLLTHPDFRRRGFGTAVTALLSEAVRGRGGIPQYRCDKRNTGSRRVAERLGFELTFRQDSLRL